MKNRIISVCATALMCVCGMPSICATAENSFDDSSVGSIKICCTREIVMYDDCSVENSEIRPAANVEFCIEGVTDDSFEDIFITDEDGIALAENLPIGEYTVTELETDATVSYVTEKPFAITVSKSETAEKSVYNRCVRGNITGVKTDENGEALAGAIIGLFADGTTEFTEKNLFCGISRKSNEYGIFTFENIPFGSYIVAEISSPENYVVNSYTSFSVYVTNDGATVTTDISGESIIIADEPIYNQLELISTVENSNSDGLSFTVEGNDYKQTFECDDNGIVRIDSLKNGTYTVTENASDKFEMYKIPQPQVITLDNENAKVTFETLLKRGQAIVTVMDEANGLALANAEIIIIDSNDVLAYQGITDENGECIADLVYGGYSVFLSKAPSGYAENYQQTHFTINDERAQVLLHIVIGNHIEPQVLSENASTGNSPLLWTGSIALALCVLIRKNTK